MGCGASKQAVVVASARDAGRLAKSASSSTASTSAKTSKHSKTDVAKTTKGASAADASGAGLDLGSRGSWAVHPGYSSGASSYSGSDDGGDDEVGGGRNRLMSDVSRHSQILSLSALRDEIVADGDLAKTVVRIETPFDTPIEEIYDGVFDGTVLGSGVSGIVRLVVHRATGIKYAVKCLDLGMIDTIAGLMQLRNEIFIMCQLDHPNIVRIEEVYESSNEIYIVQELCLGGDLFDRLDALPNFHYTEAQCAKLVKQMVSALRYLHSKGIIHRDLKLENFLFSSPAEDSELKMIDFGLSKHFEIGQCHSDKVGTPYTVAPEIIRGKYDEKSDIWSLGVIAYLLLSGETPFGGLDGENLLLVKENILRSKVSFEPKDVWESVSSEGRAFVKAMLNPDPAKRPTAKETQRSEWIQVWAKKDAKEGNKLNPKTVGALIKFKESSDMQKLLSEVLSFTLLPEQIGDLRKEFEKLDTHGDGEISLGSLKRVLMQNAEAGTLGALTEQEVEDIFNSIRVRKSEPTIRWHEFLAAGLSRARIDDRNLRLAFDRLDSQRKGFITFDDLSVVLGNSTEYEALEKIWLESLEECKAHLDRITLDDFKKLMKGQPKDAAPYPPTAGTLLSGVPEEEPVSQSGIEVALDMLDAMENPRLYCSKKRSSSYELKTSTWDSSETLSKDASLAILLQTHSAGTSESISNMSSPLATNRAIYRKHREMRFAVLEASKQFDMKRTDIQNKSVHTHAGLIMKRGTQPPVEVEDTHARALLEVAAIRCGREKHRIDKTVSDVTGMLHRAQA